MSPQQEPLNVALLGVQEVTASTLYGMFDLFSSPGRDFPFITRGIAGEQRMRPFIVARSRDEFRAANGVPVRPDHDFSDCPRPDIVCIPDFFVMPGESVAGQYDAEARWLQRIHGEGTMLASACSGAVLLGEAGLLKNCDATIHWAYVASLANYPGVKVKPHQSLVLSGEAQRIIMAGGGTSWQDLTLYLIARFVGIRKAMEVARVYMLQWHDQGQQPFAALMGFRRTNDAVINKCQDWAALNYLTHSPVAAMTALSGLPERSFVRRFSQATGLTPLDYIHGLRLEEAKQMLETGDLGVEAIANEVGYEDASFFGRLFRRKVGLTPAKYRLRFGSLHRALKTG
ncbi:helix-turn-helix domain-containing protein [Nordella sp. HKS 07]|uniref:GlxA family transcriptional regulator n=1 Tax=Nordella sp. HKS 07 TaxID=2712222 RepID=UPI0013E11A07|nr:helix-turn-helix domain-containing protein [Nordella sp. HKS 07]QIG48117.1 helix-turn-helix domain-containing protein [Nordella sp. HKS 07]